MSKSEQFRLNIQRGVKENENAVLAAALTWLICDEGSLNPERIEEIIKKYLDNRKEV